VVSDEAYLVLLLGGFVLLVVTPLRPGG